jgi:hypothetical protein
LNEATIPSLRSWCRGMHARPVCHTLDLAGRYSMMMIDLNDDLND